jgi:hypothetical protein
VWKITILRQKILFFPILGGGGPLPPLDSAQVLYIYPAMTAFTDQYSLPNIFFDIGQL